MKHWSVGARLLSCASVLALMGGVVDGASAHDSDCKSINSPTTINSDKKCVRVTKTVNGNVINNATIGKAFPGEGHGHAYGIDRKSGFFIGDGGLITGKLINNGLITGGYSGTGALLLGNDADVRGGIINNGAIISRRGSGISLGFYEHGKYGGAQTAAMTGDIVNDGLIKGEEYGVVARYGTMSGTLINEHYGVIVGGDAGVYIADSFTSWTGGIENAGLIKGGFAGIQIGDFDAHDWGGEHSSYSYGGSYSYGDAGVVFSGGITNLAGGAIISKTGPSIAVGGESFSGGITNDGLITQYSGHGGEYGGYGYDDASPYKGVGIVFTAPTVSGGVSNGANGEIYGTKGPAIWITDKTETFSGGITNHGVLAGADDGIRIESATFAGGLLNGETGAIFAIKGDAITATSAWTGDFRNDGLILGARNGFAYDGSTFDGNVVNTGIIGGGKTGVTMAGDAFNGGFANSGLIGGGKTGVSLDFATMTGGFTNSGEITGLWGDGVALRVGTLGLADARADIVNTATGVIEGGETGFLLDAGTVYGDFINDGVIIGAGENTGAHIIAGAFNGDITNNKDIGSPHDALVVEIETFNGAFTNTGAIAGGGNGAVFTLGAMSGGFTNSGSITGTYGDGLAITVDTLGSAEARADIVNESTGVITGGDTGFLLNAGTVYGDFVNDGVIHGGGENTGAHIIAGTFNGDITNNESITSPYDAFVAEIEVFNGSFANTDTIEGGVNGAVFVLGSMSGGFANSGSITGTYGDGLAISVDTLGTAEDRANIVNTSTGVITGGDTGFLLNAGTVYGDFVNDGVIHGGGENTGAHIIAGTFNGDIVNNESITSPYDAFVAEIETFNGSFANTGTIEGGVNGAVFVLGSMSGGFTNSGSITGTYGDGLAISVDTLGTAEDRANIVNTSTGVITGGDTGFLLNAGTVYGDFINDGVIHGGGVDTGLHIIAGTFNGDIVNNESITSPYDAFVAEIETFNGSFANTDTIEGGVNGAVFDLGSMSGDFTNSGSITGTSATGVDIWAGTWGSSEAPVAILNTESGVIEGGATGFALAAGEVHGSFTNEGSISGGTNGATFSVTTFDAPFANSGTISGGVNGVVMALGTASGGFENSGSISGTGGNGVDILAMNWGSAEVPADIVNSANGTIGGGANGLVVNLVTFHGDVTNDGSIEGGETGVLLAGGLFDGAFENTGGIEGGSTGVAMALETVTGPFTNSGSIDGLGNDGVAIDVGSWGSAEARADIVNTSTGIITGADTGFLLDVGTMHGDFINDGVIHGGGENTGAHIIAGTFNGDIVNNESITSPYDAFVAEIETFNGSFANTDTIEGGVNGAVFNLGSMSGDFSNSGSITGTSANGVDISVYEWGSSEAPIAILNAESGVIGGGNTGFALSGGELHGSFTNDGSITGGTNGATFSIETFDAPFANSGVINGGANGVVMALGSASGGFENSGAISGTGGNGVDILVTNWGSSEVPADFVNSATGTIAGGDDGLVVNLVTFHGDVTNHGSIDGGTTGVLLSGGLFDGAFENAGDIEGGSTGVAMSLETVTGPFTNSGSIDGASNDGVAIQVGTWGAANARADIFNTSTGVIAGGDTGFLLNAGTVYGDFVNDGVIHGDGIDTGLHIIAGTFNGDITNNDSITSPYDAFVAEIETFNGSFANTDTIEGGVNGAVFNLGSMSGDFSNSGSITGTSGNGVDISVYDWGTSEAPAAILNSESGVIEGGVTGFKLVAGTVHGSFTNEGSVTGGTNGATFNVTTFDAPFANSGVINGGANGVVMALGSASGGFENSGAISGTSGNGVDILVTNWGSAEVPADIVNTAEGTISGGANGLAVQLVTFHGDVTNDGSIDGGAIGVLLSGGLFDGAFENAGDIEGGSTGVAMTLETVAGPFTNSGSIDGLGNDGVAILVTNWGSAEARADIVNTSTGVINGADTGFLLNVGTMHGDFVNDGVIHGDGTDTGLHIIAGTFNGGITNNDLIDAPSNAMHLEIGTLNGEVVNTGTIAATESGGVAVAMAIGNGTTFTNTGGGVILGDVVFGGEAAYAFVAEDGRIEGDLIGEGDDDTITVQNGTHAFLSGAASNFQSFTVASGGLALMGAHFEGDGAGTGYGFTNVANLNVNNGGTLYIDKSTTLVVANSYTQAAGGTVEFYLGAPGGAGFSSLTGNVVAGDEDYGQIVVQGSVTLDGAVVGFLDPAYAAANPGLNQVFYDDVIIAEGGVVGDFDTLALIANSSLFEMIQVVDGNAVDITVARTALDTVAGVVVNIGGPFDAMVSDRSNGIGSGSCSLAGEGWCFNRFAANEPGASQVMTDATPDDPFAWLRTGVRKVGETAVWGRAVGAWGNTDGHAGTKGTEFDVAGAIVGVDHVFTPVFMAGIAGQWTTTDVDFRGRPDHAEVENFEAGAYLSWGDTRLYLNANASVIWHDIEVARFSPSTQALGKYDGTTLSAFAEVGKTFETAEGFRIQPFLSLSYSHLETDAYSEIGTGTLLDVSDSEFDSLKSTIGIRLAYPIPLESGRRVVPEARVGWTHEYMDDQAAFLASVQGQPDPPSIVRGEKFSRDTLVVGGGVTVPLSDSSALFVDYDAGLNPDITTHTVSAGLRITW